MKHSILTGILALATGLSGLMAQQAAPQTPAAAPQAKGPSVKSPAEQQAVAALQTAGQANDTDGIIKAAEDLLAKFADTEFKEWAYSLEARAYQMKRDDIHAEIYGTKALDINPKSYQMTLLVGEVVMGHIGEHDIDRDEKLAKAAKAFNDTIELVKTAEKPNPALPDATWAEFKKGEAAEAHNGLGLLAIYRKDYPTAVTEFKAAIEGDPQDAYTTRLASAYQLSGNNDEAIALCDKLLANPQIHPQIKAAVTSIKSQATNAKNKK